MNIYAAVNNPDRTPARPDKPRIAILGGGVGGLTIAKSLTEQGVKNLTIFEREDRVGGKSVSLATDSLIIEMGTCYATENHRRVRKWMRDLSIPLKRLKSTSVDGQAYINYVNGGTGHSLLRQTVRYLANRRRLVRQTSRAPVSRAAREEAATPTSVWLRARGLHKIERLMDRAITSLGYGFLNETSILQAMRWVDLDTILTGARHTLYMPVTGWSDFWERLSSDFDIRTATPVEQVIRRPEGVELRFADGSSEAFDVLINSIPVDEFAALTALSPQEQRIRDGVRWPGFATSLVTSNTWFTQDDIVAFSASFKPGAAPGPIISARHEGFDEQTGLHYYVVGQLPGTYSKSELAEILAAEFEQRGIHDARTVTTRIWKYFAQYDLGALSTTLLDDLHAVQGLNRTWHTGATFSHESVANISEFNHQLAATIAATLPASARRPAGAAQRSDRPSEQRSSPLANALGTNLDDTSPTIGT